MITSTRFFVCIRCISGCENVHKGDIISGPIVALFREMVMLQIPAVIPESSEVPKDSVTQHFRGSSRMQNRPETRKPLFSLLLIILSFLLLFFFFETTPGAGINENALLKIDHFYPSDVHFYFKLTDTIPSITPQPFRCERPRGKH